MARPGFVGGRKLRSKPIAGVVAVMMLAAPAAAQSGADDITSKIISIPAPTAFRVDGATSGAAVRTDSLVQGGKALRVPVPARSEQTWATSVAVPINRAVHAGDNLVLAFWARLEQGEDGATTAQLPYNSVQLASAPYTAVFAGPATIGREWKMYEVRGRADRDYAKGDLNVSLHLATGKQVIDLGPVFVLDMGK